MKTWERPATELAAALRKGTLTARQVVEACLGRIEALDAGLHAFITVAADQALAEADRQDAAAAGGRFAGPLHGLPVTVKDLLPTAGLRTTRGALLHADDIPAADDPVVARLRAAGGIVIGKTNTPAFGFGALCRNEIAGNTVSPYARDRTSGGSSGGAAVAVATGMAPLSLGTDFGGSARTPASFCNVVGFRPSAGRVPKPTKPFLWETMSTYGVMARRAADARLMLTVIAGAHAEDPASFDASLLDRIPEPQLAASATIGTAPVSVEVATCFEDAVGRIANGGFAVARAAPDFSGAQEAFETLRAAAIFHEFGADLDGNPARLPPAVRWNAERGRGLLAADIYRAEATRSRIYRSCLAFFERHDFLLLPAASVLPWPLTEPEVEQIDGVPTRNIIDYLAITYAISLVGLPAISLPAGFSRNGLPFGLQIVGPPRADGEVLTLAARLERDLGFRHSFPATG